MAVLRRVRWLRRSMLPTDREPAQQLRDAFARGPCDRCRFAERLRPRQATIHATGPGRVLAWVGIRGVNRSDFRGARVSANVGFRGS